MKWQILVLIALVSNLARAQYVPEYDYRLRKATGSFALAPNSYRVLDLFVRVADSVSDNGLAVVTGDGDCDNCLSLAIKHDGRMHDGLYFFQASLPYKQLELPVARKAGEGPGEVKVGDIIQLKSRKDRLGRVGAIFANGDIVIGDGDGYAPSARSFFMVRAGAYQKPTSVMGWIEKTCRKMLHRPSEAVAQ